MIAAVLLSKYLVFQKNSNIRWQCAGDKPLPILCHSRFTVVRIDCGTIISSVMSLERGTTCIHYSRVTLGKEASHIFALCQQVGVYDNSAIGVRVFYFMLQLMLLFISHFCCDIMNIADRTQLQEDTCNLASSFLRLINDI